MLLLHGRKAPYRSSGLELKGLSRTIIQKLVQRGLRGFILDNNFSSPLLLDFNVIKIGDYWKRNKMNTEDKVNFIMGALVSTSLILGFILGKLFN